MANGEDALEGVVLAYLVGDLRAERDFPYTRSGKVAQEVMKTGKLEAGSLLTLRNWISGFAFLRQQQCFMAIQCIMWFMIETHHRSITHYDK